MKKRQKTDLQILKYILVSALAVIVLYPILLCFINSIKPEKELYFNMLGLPQSIRFENYPEAWEKGFSTYYTNTIIITFSSVVLSIIGSLLLAYVLTRRDFRLNPVIYFLMIIGMAIPPQISATPLYLLMDKIGFMNTYIGLILAFIAYRIPFTTFIIYGYFLGIPKEIEEAARIDGCSDIQMLLRVFMPLSKPIITAAVIFSMVYVWNNYFFPLLLTTNNSMKMLANGLVQFQGQYRSSFSHMFAGVVLTSLPILVIYFFLQKQFMRGMTAGAVKG